MEISPATWILGYSRFVNTLTPPLFLNEATSHAQHLCCPATQHYGGVRCARGIIARLRGMNFAEFCTSSSSQKIMDAGNETS